MSASILEYVKYLKNQKKKKITAEAATRAAPCKNVFTKFTGKHLCKSLFINKVAYLHATSAKIRSALDLLSGF